MNWMNFRPLYLVFSGALILLSIYSIFTWKFKLSIDFTGGSIVEYKFDSPIKTEDAGNIAKSQKYELVDVKSVENENIQFRFGPSFSQPDSKTLESELGSKLNTKANIVRFELVGPSFSKEIFKKTLIAVGIASTGILLWIAFQFKNFKFGVFAVMALLHDLTILLGAYALLGHFERVEVDILVVTAFLTTLSLSLYDTIVVYDRIRESIRRYPKIPFYDIANKSITETIVRSFNTSLISAFVLFALFLLGGQTIKWFVLALLIGTITGTYSSPFVAVPLIVTWEEIRDRFKKRKQG